MFAYVYFDDLDGLDDLHGLDSLNDLNGITWNPSIFPRILEAVEFKKE